MTEARIPSDEKERIQALYEYDILDTEPEQDFDEIVQLAAYICEIGTAYISLIDTERQWLKAKVGLGFAETDRKLAFCSHTILHDDVFVVNDATKDERFFDNPLVAGLPEIRFYAGMPLITESGYKIGSLCVLDVEPRKLRDEQIQALRVLSKQVMKQLELRKTVKVLEAQRQHLKDTNEINSRLLSIIGHDVRAPFASISGLVNLMAGNLLTPEEITKAFLQIKKTMVAAEFLLHDLLQWASAQQEGNSFAREQINLYELIDELTKFFEQDFLTKKNQVINTISENERVLFDNNTLRFVLRNLLLNANKFTENGKIFVSVNKEPDKIIIHVRDTGKGMNEARVNSLFDWKMKNSTQGTQGEKGSGLALLLCNDMLIKNGARIRVQSKEGEGSIFSIILHSVV